MNTDDGFFDNVDKLRKDFENSELFKNLTYLWDNKNYIKQFIKRKENREESISKLRNLILKDLKKITLLDNINKYNFIVEINKLTNCLNIIIEAKNKNIKVIFLKTENFYFSLKVEEKINIEAIEFTKNICFYENSINVNFFNNNTKGRLLIGRLNSAKDYRAFVTQGNGGYVIDLEKVIKKLNILDSAIFLNYLFFNKPIDNEHFELLYDIKLNELELIKAYKTDLSGVFDCFVKKA